MIKIYRKYPFSKAIRLFEAQGIQVEGFAIILFNRWGFCFLKKGPRVIK